MRIALLILGSGLPVLASLTYIISIVRGQTRPQRMTRFLLVIITLLMAASLWLAGDTSGVWLALVSFVQAVVIFGVSLKRGMGGTSRLDWTCLGLCLAGLALWLLAGWPWFGLLASIVADAVAMVPALRKTMRWPHTELTLFYAIDVFAGLAIVLAGPLTLQAIVFPAYIALINLVFVIAIRWPRRQPALHQESV
jgi:hypothetical protein